jgi:putative Mg2+ transporter-C (MgtC) family protein
MNEADLSVFLRIFVIAILAGVLGWERESSGKSAGIRTHALVGISAVLFIVIGEVMVAKFQSYGDLLRFDPLIMINAMVTGISFLCAGMIFFSAGKHVVHGLTTAAGVLTTAAIGMLVGLERYVLAVGTSVIVFTVLHFLRALENKLIAKTVEDESVMNDKSE